MWSNHRDEYVITELNTVEWTASDSPKILVPKAVAASGARTLVHRRYVCTRVQELRENWNAIQNGSLSFSSSSIKSGCISSQKPENGVVLHERSG
ncbi:PHD and RING finger domain-containing protein 1-like [Pyrus ussuriensis x Pyrus communis]|uniref:PHD and RING finger domain-containing protein 1-like n=1 Tax=Pyrus ussuriensis x Pyrus communis TaxID=2448454 RepID=A0A5N5HYX0_9ROSA|nr:PHD and RING finger domain-containing protein 1-like [Pyrus ussuriensis x Pyrus communis]KAB2633116.1 PHD and RING finger domain-containing protein 1-like [Pyrus ussuriensis x Pyrus communis]